MKTYPGALLLGEPRQTAANTFEWVYPGVERENNFYMHGLFPKNDFTLDLWDFRYLAFTAEMDEAAALTVRLGLLKNMSPGPERLCFTSARCTVTNTSGQVLLPLDGFDFPASQRYDLQFCRMLEITADRPVRIGGLRFLKGAQTALECAVRSRAAGVGEAACYTLNAVNCTGRAQHVSLAQKAYGWESMQTEIEPAGFILPPYGEKAVTVRVRVSERVAPGGFERQTVEAFADGNGAGQIELVTARSLPYPHVMLDAAEAAQTRLKIETYDWPKKTLAHWARFSDEWNVPQIDPEKPYLFLSSHADLVRRTALLYAVTRREAYAEKVVKLLKAVADPKLGYRRLPKFTQQELVHEGECFRSMAVAYDIVHDSTLFAPQDHADIESTFRLFIRLIDRELQKGEISNWTLAELTGALFCAAALQDRALVERFLYGVGGATEHLSRGVFDDGWWFEASIGYNLLAAGLFTDIAQAMRHFGIDFAHLMVPASYAKSVNSAAPLKDGLCFDAWGPNRKNYRCVKMLWDSLLPYYDYRGVIFGINDSTESKFEGISGNLHDARYDIAYHIYRDPVYARHLKDLPPEQRDLIFGEGEFPPAADGETGRQQQVSTYSDNAGVAVLRSQTEGRAQREQIQVALKYGSHGGAHGHYDRASITSLMRCGRSLYNPENVWYSYHTYMYKFYVQNSITHNMVTVDLKQQDPAEPKRTLFHSGPMLQACALENDGRWCNPPYGGWLVYDATFEERVWNEGRSIEIPANHPPYAARSGFTENVLTRRLTLVTDDYVLVYDAAAGVDTHRYDCLYHLQGLQSVTGAGEPVRHTERLEDDPLSSAQFITDCDWYNLHGASKLHFETEFTETKNNGGAWVTKNRTAYNEYGVLKTDLYLLAPGDGELAVGCSPEVDKVNKQLFYRVTADGQGLASGRFGAWIFGREHVDVALAGKRTLELAVRVKDVEFEKNVPQHAKNTIFWGDPYLVTEDGEKKYLSELAYTAVNTDPGHGVGLDYEGGPVKLQTRAYPRAIPAEPADRSAEGVLTVDLIGLHAVRFCADIGGDYPVGDETGRRRVVALRSTGRAARFVTLLEPYEERPMVKNARFDGEQTIVELADGRIQKITVQGMEGTEKLSATIAEYRGGVLLRRETTESERPDTAR